MTRRPTIRPWEVPGPVRIVSALARATETRRERLVRQVAKTLTETPKAKRP